jgi:hypothetical protein
MIIPPENNGLPQEELAGDRNHYYGAGGEMDILKNLSLTDWCLAVPFRTGNAGTGP